MTRQDYTDGRGRSFSCVPGLTPNSFSYVAASAGEKLPRTEPSSWVFAIVVSALWVRLVLVPSIWLILAANLPHVWEEWSAGVGMLVLTGGGVLLSVLLHEWTHLVVLVGYPVRLRNDEQHSDLGVVLAKKTPTAKFVASALVPILTGTLVVAVAALLLQGALHHVGPVLGVVALSGVGIGLLVGGAGDFSQSIRVVWLSLRGSYTHLQDDDDHYSHLI